MSETYYQIEWRDFATSEEMENALGIELETTYFKSLDAAKNFLDANIHKIAAVIPPGMNIHRNYNEALA